MEAPYRQLETERITPDTHLIRQLWGEGAAPVAVFINSMVITGAEPVVVDTGPKVSGKEWKEAVFSIVEPEDVRWIYLSHEDHDHTGNLVEMLELCRNAKLVTTGSWPSGSPITCCPSSGCSGSTTATDSPSVIVNSWR